MQNIRLFGTYCSLAVDNLYIYKKKRTWIHSKIQMYNLATFRPEVLHLRANLKKYGAQNMFCSVCILNLKYYTFLYRLRIRMFSLGLGPVLKAQIQNLSGLFPRNIFYHNKSYHKVSMYQISCLKHC